MFFIVSISNVGSIFNKKQCVLPKKKKKSGVGGVFEMLPGVGSTRQAAHLYDSGSWKTGEWPIVSLRLLPKPLLK